MEETLFLRTRTGYYLAWIPLAGMLVLLFALPGALNWREAAILLVPLCAVYAFVCRASWYLCRFMPLKDAAPARLLGTHAAAALLDGLLWVLAARWLAWAVSSDLAGRLDRQLPMLFAMGALLYLLVVAFHYVLLALEASREAEKRAMDARLLAGEAELRALRAQVNPHFLFNSLHSISALTALDAAQAREMCILLSDFLRSTLGLGNRTSVPLREELHHLKRYLEIEQVRFRGRLELRENIEDAALECLLPPLLLQPLVENSIRHGIATLSEGGYVGIECRKEDGRLKVVVENNFDPEAPPRQKSGHGLSNVRKRLSTRYGEDARMEAGAQGNTYRVQLALPAEQGPES